MRKSRSSRTDAQDATPDNQTALNDQSLPNYQRTWKNPVLKSCTLVLSLRETSPGRRAKWSGHYALDGPPHVGQRHMVGYHGYVQRSNVFCWPKADELADCYIRLRLTPSRPRLSTRWQRSLSLEISLLTSCGRSTDCNHRRNHSWC
jgi:hypothetical protein